MKKLLILSLILASCHGKQIVPAGEPEGNDSFDAITTDGIKLKAKDQEKNFISIDSVTFGTSGKVLIGGTLQVIIIHNTDTITAYPGDTVRIKN